MKQNKYDDLDFFAAYKKMKRSVYGLEGAGEWPLLKAMIPPIEHKHVLDLGCGFGWHCQYALEQGASAVTGVDISEEMIKKARELTDDSLISYLNTSIEDVEFPESSFDIVLSSLAFHYIENMEEISEKVFRFLKPGGHFVFSVEHPVFTSNKMQDWWYDEEGNRLHWPVDDYQNEGVRNTSFLAENVIKYHRTVSSYLNNIMKEGFKLKSVKESMATKEMIAADPGMENENRRPMFLLIAAEK